MITKELLQKFCGTRCILTQPSSQGEFTVATNGRFAIWIDRMADVPEVDRFPNIFTPNGVASQWQESGMWEPMPQLPPVEALTKKCDTCHGSGSHDCSKCENSHECGTCGGAGHLEVLVKVRIGLRLLSAKYLHIMAELPGLQVNSSGESLSAMSFQFDGGKGLLMPHNDTE